MRPLRDFTPKKLGEVIWQKGRETEAVRRNLVTSESLKLKNKGPWRRQGGTATGSLAGGILRCSSICTGLPQPAHVGIGNPSVCSRALAQ